jgi:hypothetical protein
MSTRLACPVLLSVFLAGSVLLAHHSYAVVFDPTNQVTLTGTLMTVDWRNPHIELGLDVRNDRGDIEAWVIEGAAPVIFRGQNSDKVVFQNAIGKSVTMTALRARDGSAKGSLLKLTFPDGTFVISTPGSEVLAVQEHIPSGGLSHPPDGYRLPRTRIRMRLGEGTGHRGIGESQGRAVFTAAGRPRSRRQPCAYAR